MSLAVSAVVVSSRLLRGALAAYALASAAMAAALALGGARFQFSWWLAAACVLSAAVAGRAAVRGLTTHQIDISGLGEIRLTVPQSMGAAGPRVLMTLLPGSTLWPGLLLLRLRDGGSGAVTVLPVLPDSVAPAQFRMLGVALRAIARRDNKFSEKNKIH
jgi:toxin CptA